MKRSISLLGGIWLLVLAGAGQAGTINYNFASNPPPDWVNKIGNWVANGGVYYATSPSNNPPTYAYLPFSLKDFTLEVDINGTSDGGIWVHSNYNTTFNWPNGIVLVTKPPQIYWHKVVNNNWGGMYALGSMPGGTVRVKVEATGNTYKAYVNGELRTTLVDSDNTYPSGFAGVYSWSAQTFDNLTLAANGLGVNVGALMMLND